MTRRVPTVLAVLIVMAQAPASAQREGVVELSGGYAFGGAPLGAFVSVGWRPAKRFVLVGEATGSTDVTDALGIRTDTTEWAIMGGARVMPSQPGRFEPFVQVLAGVVDLDTRTWDVAPNPGNLPFDIRWRTTDVALQYGLGMTWWMGPRVGAQIATNYRRVFNRLATSDDDEFQLLFGATLGFGRKP